jgi:hypothetical protein
LKIILSRKGFDASAGGVPSPILPDGTMLPLPIPGEGQTTYADLSVAGRSLARVVEDLTKGRLRGGDTCHLDPDLERSMLPREPAWRPVFGQRGAAAVHLMQQGIGPGDLFLFFGWFREVELVDGKHRYLRGACDLHVLFGWLQVGKVVRPADEVPPWARYHPHFQFDYGPHNVVFLASRRLSIFAGELRLPGAGVFPRFYERLCLTAPYRTRSWWRLPAWFYPAGGKPPLTYHEDPSRWRPRGDWVYLRSAARGQEFVLHADRYPQALSWLQALFAGVAFDGPRAKG